MNYDGSRQYIYSQLISICGTAGVPLGDFYRRDGGHPTGQPAILAAIAAAFDRTKLQADGLRLREDAKPHVRLAQLAFVV